MNVYQLGALAGIVLLLGLASFFNKSWMAMNVCIVIDFSVVLALAYRVLGGF